MTRNDLTIRAWHDYELIDSGDNRKLERYGTVMVRAYISKLFVYLCIRKWKLHLKSIFSAYFLHIPDGPIPASPVPCCSSSIPQQALVVVPQQASVNSSLPINSFGSWFGRSLKQSDCLAGTCYGQQLRTGHARARASPPSARPARNAQSSDGRHWSSTPPGQ